MQRFDQWILVSQKIQLMNDVLFINHSTDKIIHREMYISY